jgi:hypothetical protein
MKCAMAKITNISPQDWDHSMGVLTQGKID